MGNRNRAFRNNLSYNDGHTLLVNPKVTIDKRRRELEG